MNEYEQRLVAILTELGYVSAADIEKAVNLQKQNKLPLEEILIQEKIITKDLFGQAVAEAYKVKYSTLSLRKPNKKILEEIAEDTARRYRVILLQKDKGQAVVATDNPGEEGLIEVLSQILGSNITITYALPEDIDVALALYRKDLSIRFEEIITRSPRVAAEILEETIEDALLLNASDIHFDPRDEVVVIRMRIDGELIEAARVQMKYYENIVNRIKVEARMATDQHFKPLDGAIRYKTKKGKYADLRVSIVPTFKGEKVALRVLSEYMRGLSLQDLGMDENEVAMVKATAKKPFGMMMVVGPTGSGKTTTLYGLVKHLNDPKRHIETIEDPVEYYIEGVNHIQTNETAGTTFATGLRAIVRQDPDIILVGEIRDHDTADIATNAALTGHLLLTSFHSNDAATSIPRLFEMGVEPFLLSSTLEIIISQRLVRKICEVCRYSMKFNAENYAEVFSDWQQYLKKDVSVYKGKGCEECGNTGYKGRTGLFEIISATKELRELILRAPSSQQIWELAKKQGARSMFDHGMTKVVSGVTTIEEVLRVARSENQQTNYVKN